MPEFDIVDLVAVQDLPSGIAVTKLWQLVVGDPATKKAYKTPIENAGDIIADQLGSAVNLPDRYYTIGGEMHGATLENDTNPVSPTFGKPIRLVDAYLEGKEYSIDMRGMGFMEKGPEWQNNVSGGGFHHTKTGAYFVNGQKYRVEFKPVISSVVATPDAIARFTSGVQVVTSSVTAGAAFDRKMILLQSATSLAITYTLNSAYPENVLCVVRTGGGQQKQSVVAAPAGQTMVRGVSLVPTRVVLGEIDYVFLVRIGTVWYVVAQGERWKQVGMPAFGGIPGPDLIRAQRQTLQANEYPGVDDYCVALAAAYPGSVVTIAQAAANPTKWARGGGVVMVPKWDGWFPRFLDLGAGKDPDRSEPNIVGSTEANQNKAHNHENGNFKGLMQITGTGTAVNGDNDPGNTQPNLFGMGNIVSEGGSEARPENVGFPALIHI
ncbi:hypothetical protein [Chitinophaga rhizosphaerae]|uniref:hypothetical protein n=1 Tax=Chitinophaga rhizosphaerae TaxID=1864947 RepID=UPI000F80A4EE|nr:hypothetical protein [Chitinophaga rhizosphaerae]